MEENALLLSLQVFCPCHCPIMYLGQRRENEEPQGNIDKIPLLLGSVLHDQWKVSVQNRILSKNASLPGEKQMPSRPGKASNVFLPVCSRNTLAGYGNKAGNFLFACHPGVHMVVFKPEKDGQISDTRS